MPTKGQVKVPVGAWRSLGEEKDRHSSGGAAYMQLFKGEGKGKYKWKRMELKLKI